MLYSFRPVIVGSFVVHMLLFCFLSEVGDMVDNRPECGDWNVLFCGRSYGSIFLVGRPWMLQLCSKILGNHRKDSSGFIFGLEWKHSSGDGKFVLLKEFDCCVVHDSSD